jgi:hypothetical protein
MELIRTGSPLTPRLDESPSLVLAHQLLLGARTNAFDARTDGDAFDARTNAPAAEERRARMQL